MIIKAQILLQEWRRKMFIKDKESGKYYVAIYKKYFFKFDFLTTNLALRKSGVKNLIEIEDEVYECDVKEVEKILKETAERERELLIQVYTEVLPLSEEEVSYYLGKS